jgi:spore germination protein GerM
MVGGAKGESKSDGSRRQPLLVLFAVVLLFGFGLLQSVLQQAPVRSLYWVSDAGGVAVLVAAPRRLRGADSEALVRAVLEVLVAGPLASERALGYGSEVPPETRLLAVAFADGELVVDLSTEVLAGGGVHSMVGRLMQLRYSFSELPGVRTVALTVEGAPAPLWGGEGVMVEPRWVRPEGGLPRW